jgi:hypothetical protein
MNVERPFKELKNVCSTVQMLTTGKVDISWIHFLMRGKLEESDVLNTPISSMEVCFIPDIALSYMFGRNNHYSPYVLSMCIKNNLSKKMAIDLSKIKSNLNNFPDCKTVFYKTNNDEKNSYESQLFVATKEDISSLLIKLHKDKEVVGKAPAENTMMLLQMMSMFYLKTEHLRQ